MASIMKEESLRLPIAYVLINTEFEKMEEVAREIKKIKGVVEASIICGVYDIIVKIQAETIDQLKRIVALQIRQIESVRSTTTMIIT